MAIQSQFLEVSYGDVPAFADAMKNACPGHLIHSIVKAFGKIGKSDIEKFKKEQLQGGAIHIRSKGFLNSFKSKASDPDGVHSLSEVRLTEYTGAKPFRIFETGGEIRPAQSKMLVVLTDAGRSATGRRKYSSDQLREMIASGKARIIHTKNGPAIIKVEIRQKKGQEGFAFQKGAKMTVLAWLRPKVKEPKLINFFQNYDDNTQAHNAIMEEAGKEAMEKTAASIKKLLKHK